MILYLAKELEWSLLTQLNTSVSKSELGGGYGILEWIPGIELTKYAFEKVKLYCKIEDI